MSAIGETVSRSIGDAALISEAKTGNHRAFEELCRRYSNIVMKSIRRVLRNQWDAEDALQETLLSAFTHLNSFEGRSSFSTWVTRIAINAALSRLRKNRHTTVSLDDVRDDTGSALSSVLKDEAPDAESQLIHAQRTEVMAAAIVRLPPSLRSVVELRIRDEYSGKQIAREIGISEAAVKARLMRARLLLSQPKRH